VLSLPTVAWIFNGAARRLGLDFPMNHDTFLNPRRRRLVDVNMNIGAAGHIATTDVEGERVA
jgi:hypothetical protein